MTSIAMLQKRRALILLLGITVGVTVVALVTGAFTDSGRRLLRISEEVELDGYTLSVRDYGTGRPALIIEGGLACTKELYTGLQVDLSQKTRVISYDHAGIGDSTASGNPRTLPYYVEELRSLLGHKSISPPYILLGHSLGGHIIRYYAHLYPKEVAGLIFVEHPHEDWFKYIRATWPKEDLDAYFEWWRPEGSDYEGTALKELLLYEKNCDLVRGILPPPDIPVLMFTGSANRHYHPDELERDRVKWTEMQASIIEDVTDAKHIVDWETGHVPHREKPALFEQEIAAFIDKVRATSEER